MDFTMIIYHIIVFTAEAFIMFSYSSKMFEYKFESHLKVYIYLLLSNLSACMISLLNIYWLNALFFFLINFILIYSFYKVAFLIALFNVFLLITINGLSEMIPLSVLKYFTHNIYEDNFNMLILATISKLLYFILIQFIVVLFSSKPKVNTNSQNPGTVILFCITILSFFIMISFTTINISLESNYKLSMLIVIISAFIMFINLLSYFLYWYIQKSNTQFTQMQLQLQRESVDYEYNNILLNQNEQLHILIHDTKDHLQSINSLIQSGEDNKAIDYIDNILNSASLKATTKFCDNKLLNSILARYEQLCINKSISLSIDIRKDTLHSLSDYEITTIICNLLNNAIEASEICKNPYIDLRISNISESNYTIITAVNSCIKPPLYHNSVLPQTNKIDSLNHGFGLRSIQKIIEQYNGSINTGYNQEERSFQTSIMLKEI